MLATWQTIFNFDIFSFLANNLIHFRGFLAYSSIQKLYIYISFSTLLSYHFKCLSTIRTNHFNCINMLLINNLINLP